VPESPVRVVFYGGVGEIGRNMAAVECGDSALIIDCGVSFPRAEEPGADLVLPDWDALHARDARPAAVLLTHGHYDHFGALPYLLRDFPGLPIVATDFTLALVGAALAEHVDLEPVLEPIIPGKPMRFTDVEVEAVSVSHSIPGSVAFFLHTPQGTILHSGDFKLDQTPLSESRTDLTTLGRLGAEGVDLLLVDSTNADLPGHEPSEAAVRAGLFAEAYRTSGLVVATTFASHIDRIQQLIDVALLTDRQPVVLGRSMMQNVRLAQEIGYITEEVEFGPEALEGLPREGQFVICTGSQGEAFSILGRLSRGELRPVTFQEGDTVILTSSIVPGNEVEVFRVLNALAAQGARIVYQHTHDVHVSGHARMNDLEVYLGLVSPRSVVPVHGETRHLVAQRENALSVGVDADAIHLCLNGDAVELVDGQAKRLADVVPVGSVYIDRFGSPIDSAILKQRRLLSERGVWVCTIAAGAPDAEGQILFAQHGVASPAEEEHVTRLLRDAILDVLEARPGDGAAELEPIIRQEVNTLLNRELGRKAVVLVLFS
jgi:ribonuclease J